MSTIIIFQNVISHTGQFYSHIIISLSFMSHNRMFTLSGFVAVCPTCAILCETVGDFYQLNCQHIISSKALLSLTNLECPYCRNEIRKDKVYYMPQQTIYSNVQHYLTDTDHQDIYTANGNNVDAKIFGEDDDLKKQKRKYRT